MSPSKNQSRSLFDLQGANLIDTQHSDINSTPGPLKVLIIEDSPFDAELLIRRLRSEGFNPETQVVQTEKDYLATLDETIDLILSDWVLPQFSGLRALVLMRERSLDTPFIIVSGTISEEAAVQAMRLGAYDYLLKDRVQRLGKAILNALGQKALRDEWRETQKLLHLQASALKAAANAIVITNVAGEVEWINPAFTNLTGYSPEEALGKNLSDLLKSGAQDHTFYKQMWQTILAGEVWRGEIINRRKDGAFYTEAMTITPIRDSEGRVGQFIAIKEDITQQRLTEQILEARLHFHEASAHQKLKASLTAIIDEAEKLSGSQIGFYHFVASDERTISLQSWSNQTTANFCRVEGFSEHYPLERAGVWADCIRERRAIVHNQFDQVPNRKGYPAGHALVKRELVVPVFRKDKIVAVMGVGNKTSDYTETDVQIIERLADFSWDVIEKKIADEELEIAYDATLQGWSNALELREHETAGHSQRVVKTTLRLARRLGVSEAALVDIQRGALLHDIGKMGIPDSILLKPGKLNDEEWEIMRKHPQYAHGLLSIIPYLENALEIPYSHHEKWDGTGYPRGLKGDEIPLSARIFAIVDVWDALSFDRPYRKAWPRAEIIQYIKDGSGRHFDPAIVEAFLSILEDLSHDPV